MAPRSRSRSRNKWLPLRALRCWSHGENTKPCGVCGTGCSRRSVYLPPGIQEPDSSYRNRIENARPTGFLRDALRTYAGMRPPEHRWPSEGHRQEALRGGDRLSQLFR
ncbi:MAG: hypothetical protein R6W06_08675 [Prochlorococcaceae cyanobacterium]